jgi:hypothetical protein
MKGNNKVTTLRPVTSSTADGKPTAKQSSAKNGVLEDHRVVMSRGEFLFYLRDVHRYWSTPRISFHEIEELEQQNLIERNTTAICAIRLTEEGARVKNQRRRKTP